MAKSDNALICEKRGFVVGDVIEGAENGHIARLKNIFIGNDIVVFNELKKVNGIWQFSRRNCRMGVKRKELAKYKHKRVILSIFRNKQNYKGFSFIRNQESISRNFAVM